MSFLAKMATAVNRLQLHLLQDDVFIHGDNNVLLRPLREAVLPVDHHVAQPGLVVGYITLVLYHLSYK